jgi:hypothetical protein
MLKVRYNCFCSLLVLFSGLISCSKDKQIQLKPDSFTADGLKIEGSSSTYRFSSNIINLDVSGQLVVESLRQEDFKDKPVNFTVITRCADVKSNVSSSSEYQQKNSAIFPVINLIPAELLLLTQDQPVHCDFTLTAENSNTSKYVSSLKGVKITGLSQFSNYELPFLTNNATFFEDSKNIPLNPDLNGSSVRIHCDEFGSEKSTATTVTLAELIESSDLKNISSPAQHCRILVRSQGANLLSPLFQLKMLFEPLTIITEIPEFNDSSSAIKDHPALLVRIANTNSFPIKLNISQANKSTYSFQPLMFMNAAPMEWRLGTLLTRVIEWQVASSEVLSEENRIDVFVPPHGEISITGQTQIHHSCSNENTWTMTGWAFGFDIQSVFSVNPYGDNELVLPISWTGTKQTSPYTPLTHWVFHWERLPIRATTGATFQDLIPGIPFQNYFCRDI